MGVSNRLALVLVTFILLQQSQMPVRVRCDCLCRYVQYETKLEELRRLRKDSKALKGKKGLAEHAIVRRIHFIYERATRKFRGDLRLWSAWLDFCKDTGSKRKLSQVHKPGTKCLSTCAQSLVAMQA